MKSTQARRSPRVFLRVFLGVILGFFCTQAQASVWNTENQWSKEWEDRYSQWVKTDWDEQFFAKPDTPFTGLKLDCADAVYSMRIIYSYLNKLPFAMNDPSGGKKHITNEMSRFDDLPPEKRIRSFLEFIYDIASTHSLPEDTYSAPIHRDSVRSGSLIRTDEKSHHSWTIKQVLPTGIPHLIFSSRPAKNVLLVRIGQPSMEFTFAGQLDPSRHAGFRNFRRIEDLDKPEWQVQGYSDEQYRFPYDQWQSIVKKRLAVVEESGGALLTRELELACTNARERVGNVNEGLEFLAKAGNRCLEASEYDDYSTPSRDLRLKNSFEELRDSFSALEANPSEFSKLPRKLVLQVQDVLSDSSWTSAQNRFCPVEITEGHFLSLGEIRRRSLENKLSINPHDSIDYRWGELAGHGVLATHCPSFD